jgi:hypothetical protein
MKEIITYTYEAFDGTIFEDEDECREYEMKEKVKTSSLTMLNYKWEALDNNKAISFEEAVALIVNKQEDIDFVKELAKEYGYTCPWSRSWSSSNSICEEKLGVYVYDEDNDRWVNFDDKFAMIRDIYTKCLAYRKDMTPFERKNGAD